MRGYLYILQSKKNYRYYIGSTTDWERRLKEHNDGKSPYTRTTRPWTIKYIKEFENLIEARKEERKLKKLKSSKIIEELIRVG
jgi:putative endonuclease